jgi:hypothetical protein
MNNNDFQSFVFGESIYKQIQELPQELQLKFLKACCEYGLYNIEPDFVGLEKALWLSMQNLLRIFKDKREINRNNGNKGGRPKHNPTKPNESEHNPTKPNESEQKANVNVNGNVNVDVNVDVNGNVKTLSLSKEKFKKENSQTFSEPKQEPEPEPNSEPEPSPPQNLPLPPADSLFLPFIVLEDKHLQNQWKDLVKEWLEYKKEIKDSYKSNKSIKAFYQKLYQMANGELSLAKEILNNSIANGYRGIFPLQKSRTPQNPNQPPKPQLSRSEQNRLTLMRDFPEVFEENTKTPQNNNPLPVVSYNTSLPITPSTNHT